MSLEPNTRIARCIQFLAYDYDSDFDKNAFYRRVVGIVGVNGIISLINRRKTPTVKSLLDGLLLIVAIPLLRKKIRQKHTSWLLGFLIGLSQLKVQLPHWIVAYWTVESVVDRIKLWVDFNSISKRRWVFLRQLTVSALIPVLYHRNISKGRLYKILFENRKPWKDFLLLFVTWNIVKTYKSVKSILSKEKAEKSNVKSSSMKFDAEVNESQSQQSSMTKMLMQRLEELNELSDSKSSGSIKERVYGYFFSDNFMKCVKWTIWRQAVMLIFNGQHSKCLKPVHKSTIIMLSFILLSDPQPLDVNWELLKYLGRTTLAQELSRVPQYQKPIIFGALNLSYFTRNPI
ncbi:unnamed protein product [Kluyveromyces dobzhanskii CBS 2104]|uniref:WGS project CCBQ000000000 data, contig 00010 n=1 Tax=Kluyveromyces dobzhanskii CBS 2104 TaxID=1427455 RepID=A0A0A8LD35_9SACH|nr:unnamed protein product [Kluyveromyces dobzhanskii CBS 2104]